MEGPLGFLVAGLVLGLAAGFSPGPLLAMVVAQALRHGLREGVKVAFVPLITDVPVILLSTLVLTGLASHGPVLGTISVAGGLFVGYLAYESLRTGPMELSADARPPRSLTTGALINMLSPHPYLFWLTVGAPTIHKGIARSWLEPALFLGGFYVCLVGSKVLVAVLVGRSRGLLTGQAYVNTMRGLGLLLLVFAVVLLAEGARLLA
jgi:threonine/homoserine/homoserine lactone efflux protein